MLPVLWIISLCATLSAGRFLSNDKDRNNFIGRVGTIVDETGTFCFVWALIPNHVHMLLRTGNCPLSTVKRRLLTGDAFLTAVAAAVSKSL